MTNAELIEEIEEARRRRDAANEVLDAADRAGLTPIEAFEKEYLEAERDLKELLNEASYRAFADPKWRDPV